MIVQIPGFRFPVKRLAREVYASTSVVHYMRLEQLAQFDHHHKNKHKHHHHRHHHQQPSLLRHLQRNFMPAVHFMRLGPTCEICNQHHANLNTTNENLNTTNRDHE